MSKPSYFIGHTQSKTKRFDSRLDVISQSKKSNSARTVSDSSTKSKIGDKSTLPVGKESINISYLGENSSLFDKSRISQIERQSREIFKQYPSAPDRKLEVEVRLSTNGSSVGYNNFMTVYDFLKANFTVNESNFLENYSDEQNSSDSYRITFVSRKYQSEQKEELYKKLKFKSPIYMDTISPFATRVGVSLEFKPMSEADAALKLKTKERTRWSFDLNEKDLRKLPNFLSKIYPDDSEFFPGEQKVRIDLTRTSYVSTRDNKISNVIYEIELELMDVSTPSDIKESSFVFLESWVKILSVVASKRGDYVPEDVYIQGTRLFNSIFDKKLDTLDTSMKNKPKDLKFDDFSWISSPTNEAVFSFEGGTHISLKADGVRRFIYISRDKIYLVDPEKANMTIIEDVSVMDNDINGTVLDVELITKLDVYGISDRYVFLAFDCLSYKNKDVRETSYGSRLDCVRNTIEKMKDLNLEKTFVNFKETILLPGPESKNPSLWMDTISDFFDKHMEENRIDFKKQVLSDGTVWEVDGFIITPENKPYISYSTEKNKGGEPGNFTVTWVRKWKTVITIDFKVMKDSKGKWKLCSSYTIDIKYRRGSHDEVQYKPFQPRGVIFVEPPQEELERYAYSIVECKWVFIDEEKLKGTFELIRVRSDRETPNPINLANTLMEHILDPIDREYFLDKKMRFMRSYHNRVKRSLLETQTFGEAGKKVLVDLGSGRGGDLFKWKNYAKVYAVEPDSENLEELIRRNLRISLDINTDLKVNNLNDFQNISHSIQRQTNIINAINYASSQEEDSFYSQRPKISIINSSAENVENLLSQIPRNGADVVTLFNVLTFFYRSQAMLDQLVTTVDNLIKKNGHFIVIAMDGKKMNNLLGSRNVIKSDNILVSRTEDPRKIWIQITDGIVRGQYEYLTRLDDFAFLMASRGYELKDSYYLDQETLLSKESMIFSSLFKAMIFQKGANSKQIKLKNSLRWLKQKDDMEKSIRMLTPHDKPINIKSSYFDERNIVNLYRFGVLGDGSCYIHAILRTVSKSYKSMPIPEKAQFIKDVRENLAHNYTIQIHNSIGDGFFRESKLPEFSFRRIKESLRDSKEHIIHYMLEYIGDQLGVNVYMLRGNQNAIPYNYGKDVSHIKPNRHNIVLYWINENHYEAVGQIKQNQVQFVFPEDSDFIKYF